MTAIEELDDIAHGLHVKWRKANNYFNTLAQDVFAVRKRFEAGEFPGYTFAGWLSSKGFSEKFLMQQFLLFKRILAEEEREKVMQINEELNRAQRQAAAAERERKRIAKEEREAATAAKRAAAEEEHRQAAAKKAEEQAAKEQEEERVRKLAAAVVNQRPTKITPELCAEIRHRILNNLPLKKQELVTLFGLGKNTVDSAISRVRGELEEQVRTGAILPVSRSPRRRRDSRDTITTIRDKPAANGSEPKPQPQPDPPVNNTPIQKGDEIAKAIHPVLTRASGRQKVDHDNRLGWIDDTEELAKLFGEARKLYPSDPEFGQWRKTHNLGNDVISDKDCTALIGMSRNLAATRIKLETNDSWSWQLIWREMSTYSANVSGVDLGGFAQEGLPN
jgi:hypothetical protein